MAANHLEHMAKKMCYFFGSNRSLPFIIQEIFLKYVVGDATVSTSNAVARKHMSDDSVFLI